MSERPRRCVAGGSGESRQEMAREAKGHRFNAISRYEQPRGPIAGIGNAPRALSSFASRERACIGAVVLREQPRIGRVPHLRSRVIRIYRPASPRVYRPAAALGKHFLLKPRGNHVSLDDASIQPHTLELLHGRVICSYLTWGRCTWI